METYLVYTTLTSWNEPPRSRHQVANVLKKQGVVYFVERSKIGLPKVIISQVAENVFTVTPYHPIDYRVRYRTPVLNEQYHNWLLQKIKSMPVRFGIVFTFDHTSYLITRFFDNVLYYCGDDFIGNATISLPWINRYHRKIERKLATCAKMVVVTSDYLYTRHSAFNKNTHLVTLGAPVITHPASYRNATHKIPVLGIVAFLNRRMPLELFDGLLKKFKIIFVGPADRNITARYRNHENAVFTGALSGEALYSQLGAIDVCIAPYDEAKINNGVTPNKLWLYLALGKPCVVTAIPNIRTWTFEDKLVYKCSNAQFMQVCEKAFEEDTEDLFYKRITFARQNSWEAKVQTILDLYNQTNAKTHVMAINSDDTIYKK